MTVTADRARKSWIDLINESVHTSDDTDIGDIHSVSRNFVVVKRGFVNTHYYYIPISKVNGWDGNVLWINGTENEIMANYERDRVPDPTRYYVKDYPYYNPAYLPDISMIPARYRPTVYPTQAPPGPDEPRVYKCDLCDNSFEDEDELSKHIESKHVDN
jgi:hypothetical protein